MHKKQNLLKNSWVLGKDQENAEWHYSTLTCISYCYYFFEILRTVVGFFYFSVCFFLLPIVHFTTSFFVLSTHAFVRIGTFFSRICGEFFHFFLKRTAWLSRPYHIQISRSSGTTLVFFFLCALILLSPFFFLSRIGSVYALKTGVLQHAKKGMGFFIDGKTALEHFDFQQATQNFKKSHEEFLLSQKEANRVPAPIRFIFLHLPIQKMKELKTETTLLDAGLHAADIAEKASQSIQENIGTEKEFSSFDQVVRIHKDLKPLQKKLTATLSLIHSIDTRALPKEYQKEIKNIQSMLREYDGFDSELFDFLALFEGVAGMEKPKRYLVILQNNNELRATGGFMGAFALVDVSHGAVKKMSIPSGGSYDLKGNFGVSLIPPFPLQRLIDTWQFQDANWFPDFPETAKKIVWFYTKAEGPTVDGVIAINASFTSKLLDITGPVRMPEYNKILTSQNVISEIEKSVELEFDPHTQKPKQFLSDFIPRVFEQLAANQASYQVKKIAALLPAALMERDIQVYLNDINDQDRIKKYGIDGSLHESKNDYLMIVNSNIGGHKTDGVMTQDVSYRIEEQPDMNYRATLTITRTHHGKEGDFFTGVPNVNFMRIYIPQDSTLLTASGFDTSLSVRIQNPPATARIDNDLLRIQGQIMYDPKQKIYSHQEMGKHVLSNFVQTNVGKTSTVTISYLLPKKVFDTPLNLYSLLLQHQSGVPQSKFSFRFIKAHGETLTWSNKRDIIENDNSLVWQTENFIHDEIVRFQLKK